MRYSTDMMTVNSTDENKPKKAGWVGPAVEYGPLALFLVSYWLWGLIAATKVLVGATAVALALSWLLTRRIPKMPLITAVIVVIFGGLTIWLKDDIFIKLKPTIVQAIFAILLLGGSYLGKQPLRYAMGHALKLTETGWTILTRRMGWFFVAAAIANELVWRTQTTDVWVLFKFPGLVLATFLFFMAQLPLLQRHTPQEPAADAE